MEYSKFNEEREKLASLISDYLYSYLESTRVNQVKWEASRQSSFDEVKIGRYDLMTLRNFLILYKIDRLEELEVVNDIIAQSLRDLLYLKIDLNNKIGKIEAGNKKGSNGELIRLINEDLKIEEVFDKYHLIDELSLQKIIDDNIKNEDYGNLKYNVGKEAEIYDEVANEEDNDINRTVKYLNALFEKSGYRNFSDDVCENTKTR